jgi:hypothetical protein
MPSLQDASRMTSRVFPLDGGSPVVLDDRCLMSWTPDGRFVTLAFLGEDSTTIIPMLPDGLLPVFPASEIWTKADLARIRGAQIIPRRGAVPGPDPSIYVFVRASAQRNLYRIPLQ